jgi:hypothetical protein
MDQYGLRRACQWAGNGPTTAIKHYALARKCDFENVGISTKNLTQNPTQNPTLNRQAPTQEKPTKKAPSRIRETRRCYEVGVEGLEPPTLSV